MNNDTKAQLADKTQLFQALYKLYLAWHMRCETFPKKDRFVVGQKTENLLLEGLVLVVEAYHTNKLLHKKEILDKVNIMLECAKITIRLAKDIGAIEQRQYLEYESLLQEMGKMIGGWIRQIQNSPVK